MKTLLIIFIVLNNGMFKVVQDKEMSADECVNASLVINQDTSSPYNAACFHVLDKEKI